jgi:hypothetical protein
MLSGRRSLFESFTGKKTPAKKPAHPGPRQQDHDVVCGDERFEEGSTVRPMATGCPETTQRRRAQLTLRAWTKRTSQLLIRVSRRVRTPKVCSANKFGPDGL